MTIQSGQYQSESHELEAIELESIVIDPPVLHLEKGKTAFLKAFAVWSDGTRTEITEEARWSTGESRVGFVTDPGLVTVESNGIMVIEAIYEERQAESVVVAVASQNDKPEPKGKETGTREPSTKDPSSKKRTKKESVSLEEASKEHASATPAIQKQSSHETLIKRFSEKKSAKKAMIVLAVAVVLVGSGGFAVRGLNQPSAPAASAVQQNEGGPSQAPTSTSTESAGIGETMEQPSIPTLTPLTQSELQTTAQTSDQQQAPLQQQPVQPPSSSQTNPPTAQTNSAKPSQPQTSTKLTPTNTTKPARPAATKPVTPRPTASKPKPTTTTTTTRTTTTITTTATIKATKPVKTTKTAQLIPVQQGGKWGYATSDGFGGKTLVVPYQFDHATGFSEGLGLVKQNGKFGYINSEGQLVISAQFDYASPFAGGKATVKQNGKLGTINKSGVFTARAQ